jgi:hypothetical protein
MADIQTVAEALARLGIGVQLTWLQALDNYLREGSAAAGNGLLPGLNASMTLQRRAFEHWLDSDVATIGTPSLPHGVSNMHQQVAFSLTHWLAH